LTFTVNSVTRCAGLTHWTATITFSGGATVPIDTDQAELQIDFPANRDQARTAILNRLRSAAKEAGAGTFAQVKTALEGKTFQI
jgi:hypothetical protein